MTDVGSSADALRAKAEHAAELRTFARRLRTIRFRGTEAYLQDIDELARALQRRADEIVPVVVASPHRAPHSAEHTRPILHTTRVVGPTGAVATVTLRRKRVA
jgi:hypothetical protein